MAGQSSAMIGLSWADVSVLGSQVFGQVLMDSCGRVNKTLWQITRFKRLGAPREKLITLYLIKVRSVLMFGAASFHSSLSQELNRHLR